MKHATKTLFFAIWLLLPAKPCSAITEIETDNSYHELIGSGRITGAYLHYPDIPEIYPDGDDGISAVVLRLIADGEVGDPFEYELNLFSDLSRAPSLDLSGSLATAGARESVYRTKYLHLDFWDDGSINGRAGVDRLKLSFTKESYSLSIGRMPINYSVTGIFAVNDFFAPFSATAVNTIYKPGVDGARFSWSPGSLSTVELAFALGNNDDVPQWGSSAVLIHARTVVWNFEWSLLTGKLAQRWIAGASIQGEVGPIALRGEGHMGFPDSNGDLSPDDPETRLSPRDEVYGRLAAGADWLTTWHNAAIGAEYMFISNGAIDTGDYLTRATKLYPDDQPFLGQHYAGLSAGIDIVPILRLQTMAMLNATDLSGLAALSLLYNIADEADAALGALIPWGKRSQLNETTTVPVVNIGSEYGTLPTIFFAETRFYF